MNSKITSLIVVLNFLLFIFSSLNNIQIKIGDSLFSFLKIPIFNSIYKLKNFYNSYIFFFTQTEILKEHLKKLREENKLLKTKVLLYKNIKDQSEIRSLNLIKAEVISKCFFSELNCIYIDAGKDKNIYEGMGVISKDGIVGIVIKTYTNFSKILLLTDPNFSIDVIIKPAIKGILYGIGNNKCIVKYLPLTEKIENNSLIITSNFSGIFPYGIPVGKIKKIKKGDLYQSAIIEPVVNFEKLNYVFVLAR